MNWIKHTFYGFFCVVLVGCHSEGIFTKDVVSDQAEQVEKSPTEDTTSPILLSIEITPKPFSIVQNPETQDYLLGIDYEVQFVATGHYEDGSEQDITQQVAWSVSDAYVARMDSNILTSQQKGRVTLQARLGPYVSNTLDVLINPVGLVTWGRSINSSRYIMPRSYIPVGIRQLVANDYSFAALKMDGTVTTFGLNYGGAFDETIIDSCAPVCPGYHLQSRLVNVKKLFASQNSKIVVGRPNNSFVALRHDGSLEWWGDEHLFYPDYGVSSFRGDYDNIENALDGIAVKASFYFLTQDSGVMGFGSLNSHSTFNEAKEDLVNIKKLVAGKYMFEVAALRQDGTVIWFDLSLSYTRRLEEELTHVIEVEPLLEGFIAYREDGSAVYWGNVGDNFEVQVYDNVKKAYSSAKHGVILTNDGDIIEMRTRELILAGDENNPVMDIVATPYGEAFAALMKNGDVFSWGKATSPNVIEGNLNFGSGRNIDYQDVAADLHDVVKIHATTLSLLAVKKDGSVVTWGDAENGGDSSSAKDQLFNVVDVRATNFASANDVTALRQDGTLVVWGSGIVNQDQVSQFKNVAHILSNEANFAGIQVWEE